VAILGSIISLTGCATTDTGKYQEIPVTSDPSGATVRADTGETTITPGKLYLSRDKRHTLVAEYPDCKSQKLTLHNEAQGWALGNVISGGLVDLVADCGDGSKYELIPKEVHFNFVEPAEQADLEAKPQIQSETPRDINDNFVKPAVQTALETKPQIQSETPRDSNDNFVKPAVQTGLETKPQTQSQTPQDVNDNCVKPAEQAGLEAGPQIQSETPQDGNDNIDITPICSICGRKLGKQDGLHIYRLKLVCPKCFKKVTK
jgi:hypothetical protein